MAGTLLIRITKSAGQLDGLRHRYLWSAWLDARLLGKGHALTSEEAESLAMDLVTDLVTPEEVEHIAVAGPDIVGIGENRVES